MFRYCCLATWWGGINGFFVGSIGRAGFEGNWYFGDSEPLYLLTDFFERRCSLPSTTENWVLGKSGTRDHTTAKMCWDSIFERLVTSADDYNQSEKYVHGNKNFYIYSFTVFWMYLVF